MLEWGLLEKSRIRAKYLPGHPSVSYGSCLNYNIHLYIFRHTIDIGYISDKFKYAHCRFSAEKRDARPYGTGMMRADTMQIW